MMLATKKDIINKLQKELLPLQGFKPVQPADDVNIGLTHINHAFPGNKFPLGVIHEFICSNNEEIAATSGFASGILSALMRGGRVCIWVSNARKLFPPALQTFGIEPDKIIFIDVQKEKDALWIIEEALRCEGLAAVVGEIKELDFTSSRRLQLAVENSRVTGFIFRCNPKFLSTTASVARWKITPLPGEIPDDMPGVGFPKWNVTLLKIRNGQPGSWETTWMHKSFHPVYKQAPVIQTQKKKAG